MIGNATKNLLRFWLTGDKRNTTVTTKCAFVTVQLHFCGLKI